jgi:hypothetical protein
MAQPFIFQDEEIAQIRKRLSALEDERLQDARCHRRAYPEASRNGVGRVQGASLMNVAGVFQMAIIARRGQRLAKTPRTRLRA